ncbi:MAG: HDOD domain-containing protein [Methylococcaceae bacterium]|jgi:HD-like signal output (HDOD) protein
MQFTTVQDFLDHVKKELDTNRLVLPSLPDIAIKVRNAVAKEDITAKELADLITTDAALSAQLIHVANSPLYRGNTAINNIQLAVTRLGIKAIRTLVTNIAMQQMFSQPSKSMEDQLRGIWEQNISVASISHALAHFAPHLDADECMLAGLIHQIGKLPILALAENIPEFRDNPARLAKLLEKAHPVVGRLIMSYWEFPENLKPVAYEYVNLQYDSGSKADYVDVVQVAFLQSVAGTNHPINKVDYSKAPSFVKLGLLPEMEILEIEGISEDIELAKNTFT